jgi:succinoglycan biosynthesis protein ExoO
MTLLTSHCPEISVIIPTYNTEKYIEQAVNSVLSQTFTNFEIIVVDDASADNTCRILSSIQDCRLKVFRQSINAGAGATRNRALQEARGNWIAVLDSDDWYAPERLGTLLAFAQEHQADMVADDLYIIEDGATQPRATLVGYSGIAVPDTITVDPVAFVLSDIEGRRGLSLGFSKPLFRHQFLIEHQITYQPDIKVSQDFWLDMDCLIRGAKFYFLPEPHYYYRSRDGALTTSTNRFERLSQECDVINRFLQNEQKLLSHSTELVAALGLKLQETKRCRDYCAVVDTIKQQNFLKAFYLSLHHPLFYQQFLSEGPKVIQRRLSKFFQGKHVYEKFV